MEKILQYLALVDENDRRFLDNLAALLYRHLEKRGCLERMDGEVTHKKARVLRMVLEMENPEYIELVGRFAGNLSK